MLTSVEERRVKPSHSIQLFSTEGNFLRWKGGMGGKEKFEVLSLDFGDKVFRGGSAALCAALIRYAGEQYLIQKIYIEANSDPCIRTGNL